MGYGAPDQKWLDLALTLMPQAQPVRTEESQWTVFRRRIRTRPEEPFMSRMPRSLFFAAWMVCVGLEIASAQLVTEGPVRAEEEDALVGVWLDPFAIAVEDVLTASLDDIAAELNVQDGIELLDLRVVAVTQEGTVYVAGESAFADPPFDRMTNETHVWTSGDGGSTWSLLITRQPGNRCDYDARLHAAALHPDGKSVFLAFAAAIYLDSRLLPKPGDAAGATAIHVSQNGEFLYAATRDLRAQCEFSTRHISSAGIYRVSLWETRLRWEVVTRQYMSAIQPVTRIGSDPDNPDVVYYGNENLLYRAEWLPPEAYGWSTVDAAGVPGHVTFRGELATAQEFLRVQEQYAIGWTKRDSDFRYQWRGFLFGHQGVAYASYRGEFSHLVSEGHIASRDAGVSWHFVGGQQSFSRPSFSLAADARGYLDISGQSISGQDLSVGSWNVDPVDPLTVYAILRGQDLVYQSYDHGFTWTALGHGLPTLTISGVGIDSLGSIYLPVADEVFTKPVARRVARVRDVAVPPFVGRGDKVTVTAHINAWPALDRPPPAELEVRFLLEPEFSTSPKPESWIDMNDSGEASDSVAGDGMWSGALEIDHRRLYGSYGLIVAATLPGQPSTRASHRANTRIVPKQPYRVFADEFQQDWRCESSAGDPILSSSEHAHTGTSALRVEGDVTCHWDGIPPIHPYHRTLEMWAYSESGTDLLYVQDLTQRDDLPSIPAGQWVQLSIAAESLHASPEIPSSERREIEPALIRQLRFRSSTPVWLDDIRLTSAHPDAPRDDPTAIVGPVVTLPAQSSMSPVFPNPFNAMADIPFHLERSLSVRLTVYNIAGQQVRLLVNGRRSPGAHSVAWDGRDDQGRPASTGVYLFHLETDGQVHGRRAVLLR